MLRNGPAPTKKIIGEVRELTREDLERFRKPRNKLPLIQRMTDQHHRLARLFAYGFSMAEVNEKTGVSISRLRTYRADPSFRNLIAEMGGEITEAHKQEIDEFNRLMIDDALKAEQLIAEALEAAMEPEAEKIPLKTLVAIVADRADRTGYGKKTTVQNINVDLAVRIEKARQRSQALPAPEVIEGTAVNSALSVREAPRLTGSPSDAEPLKFRRLA